MQSNPTECVDEIKKSLIMAIERTDLNLTSIDNSANDIFTEFQRTSLSKIREAIRKGSLGEYGSTYKLTTQEICIWIRKYLKSKESNLNF